jgi:hypothetical protein
VRPYQERISLHCSISCFLCVSPKPLSVVVSRKNFEPCGSELPDRDILGNHRMIYASSLLFPFVFYFFNRGCVCLIRKKKRSQIIVTKQRCRTKMVSDNLFRSHASISFFFWLHCLCSCSASFHSLFAD